MTFAKAQKEILNEDEWEELVALKNAINERPQSVVPEKLEQFTEYLVRSLRERGG
jgi:hypothetical protein